MPREDYLSGYPRTTSGGNSNRGRGSTRRPGPRDPSMDNPGADIQTWNAYRQLSGSDVGTPGAGYQFTTFAPAWRAGQTAMRSGGNQYAPSYSGGGWGGGWGGGGGGGGGGMPQMTQAMLDQMLKALGVMGPTLNYTPVDLPSFVGQNLPTFNPAVYNQATTQLNQAAAADTSNINAAAARAQQALQANYTNPYASAQVQAGPPAEQVGSALQATAGGGGDQAAVAAETNAAGASDQASFANLLNVLAATDQAAQSSRMNQTTLDQNTALQALGAQQRGLLGGINMARTQAYNQWQQADAERRYQNSLMAQQWNREEMMRNQDLRNQATQANWQQRTSMIDARLTPLLQLLAQPGSGVEKLNLRGIQQLLAGWGAPLA